MRNRCRCSHLLAQFLLPVLLLSVALACPRKALAETPNAVIVIIDGVRYSETFGDSTHHNIPHLWNDLRPLGAVYTGFYNHAHTRTIGAHSTLLTGNDSWVSFPPWTNPTPVHRPATPTFFEYLRAATGGDATQAWLIANQGMPSMEGLVYSLHPQYGQALGGTWRLGPREDEDVEAEVETILDQYHPRFFLINLHGTDRWAHAGDWARYNERIRDADYLSYRLWQKLQSDPFYADQTTFVVTTDHGRHSWDFREHGDACTGCQHIMFLALGPEIRQGVEISSPRRYLEDIAPTLGWLMGVPMPYVMEGEVMSEALRVTPTDLPAPYVPADALEVSTAVYDAAGIPRTAFQPGETIFADTTVVNHTASDVLLYQAALRGGLCPDGEVAEIGRYFGEPPTFLSPESPWLLSSHFSLPTYTPVGEWPLSVEWQGVDAAGALVRGTSTVTLTVQPRLLLPGITLLPRLQRSAPLREAPRTERPQPPLALR